MHLISYEDACRSFVGNGTRLMLFVDDLATRINERKYKEFLLHLFNIIHMKKKKKKKRKREAKKEEDRQMIEGFWKRLNANYPFCPPSLFYSLVFKRDFYTCC